MKLSTGKHFICDSHLVEDAVVPSKVNVCPFPYLSFLSLYSILTPSPLKNILTPQQTESTLKYDRFVWVELLKCTKPDPRSKFLRRAFWWKGVPFLPGSNQWRRDPRKEMENDQFYSWGFNNSQNMGLLGKVGLEDDVDFWAKMVASYTSLLNW